MSAFVCRWGVCGCNMHAIVRVCGFASARACVCVYVCMHACMRACVHENNSNCGEYSDYWLHRGIRNVEIW